MDKRKWIMLLVGIICLSFLITAYAQDFRQANWGMSKEEVRAIESAEPDYESEDGLGYDVTIDGKNFLCLYAFLEDKLYQAGYHYVDTHVNDNNYIVNFEELKELLIQKYGKPKVDEIIWKNDLFKDDIQHWGMAICMGHLEYYTAWENESTRTLIKLYGDNYEISMIIGYYSKQLEDWADNIQNKQALQNF